MIFVYQQHENNLSEEESFDDNRCLFDRTSVDSLFHGAQINVIQKTRESNGMSQNPLDFLQLKKQPTQSVTVKKQNGKISITFLDEISRFISDDVPFGASGRYYLSVEERFSVSTLASLRMLYNDPNENSDDIIWMLENLRLMTPEFKVFLYKINEFIDVLVC